MSQSQIVTAFRLFGGLFVK